MKMTKIAFWRKVKENCEKNEVVPCIGIYDSNCPYGIDSKECKMCEGGNRKKALAYATAYIKRHEGKSKKKVNVDTVKSNLKGDEHIVPNPYPTPLEVAKMIRDNGYKCTQSNLVCVGFCPIRKNKFQTCGCANENDPIMFNIRKTLIDSYISSHEKVESRPNFRKYLRDKVDMKVKVTPELSIELQKISNEENVMFWFENRTALIRDIDHKFIIFSTNGKGLFCRICRHEKDLDPEFKKFKEYNPATDSLVEPVENAEKPEPEPVCEHLVGDLCGNAFETYDKECPANSEILKPEPVIEPIKFQLPKIAFVVFADGIGVRSKNFTIDSDGNLTHSGCLCYDNIDKAVTVWNATYGKEVKK